MTDHIEQPSFSDKELEAIWNELDDDIGDVNPHGRHAALKIEEYLRDTGYFERQAEKRIIEAAQRAAERDEKARRARAILTNPTLTAEQKNVRLKEEKL